VYFGQTSDNLLGISTAIDDVSAFFNFGGYGNNTFSGGQVPGTAPSGSGVNEGGNTCALPLGWGPCP
jgi:hypothetical protein